MKAIVRTLLLWGAVVAMSACANQPPQTASGKKLKLETIDHGPLRPKTYVYREVDDPASR